MTVCKNNINPLYSNYFKLTFSRGTSQFELMCQRANLPGITIGETKQPTTLGTTIPIPTLSATFEPLRVEFIVDNDLTNWKSIYSWMRNVTNISEDNQYNIDYQSWHIKATLDILDPVNCNDVLLSFTFNNVIPISLGGINFQTDNSDVNLVKTTASFAYSYYTMIPDAESDLTNQV